MVEDSKEEIIRFSFQNSRVGEIITYKKNKDTT